MVLSNRGRGVIPVYASTLVLRGTVCESTLIRYVRERAPDRADPKLFLKSGFCF